MKKVIWIGSFALIALLGAGGFWLWKIIQPAALPTDQAAVTKVTEGVGSSGAGAAGSNASGTPLVLSKEKPAEQQSGTATAKCGDNGTLDPAKFNVYDACKNETSAQFGDISPGTGAEAVAGKKVTVNYRGWLTNGKVFDENVSESNPFSFVLGQGQVIKGWEQAITGMKVGGERLIIVPPAAGYGDQANGPIPANSVMVFDVRLTKVE